MALSSHSGVVIEKGKAVTAQRLQLRTFNTFNVRTTFLT